LSGKYKSSSEEMESLRRKIKEKEKFVTFLEKEVQRRNEEIDNLVGLEWTYID
jgi:hypothetical protein